MQRTGAYKVRGAYYKISTLTEEERAKGLIAASAGNHAQGVAYAAHNLVQSSDRYADNNTSDQVERTKSYGADVILKEMYMMRHVLMHWNLLRKKVYIYPSV